MPDNLELLHRGVRNPFFQPSFTLSRELDATRIEATLKDGVRGLHVQKAEEARPRRIDIQVG